MLLQRGYVGHSLELTFARSDIWRSVVDSSYRLTSTRSIYCLATLFTANAMIAHPSIARGRKTETIEFPAPCSPDAVKASRRSEESRVEINLPRYGEGELEKMAFFCRKSLGIDDLRTLHIFERAPLLKRAVIVRVHRDAKRTGIGLPFEGVDEGRQKSK